MKSRDGKITHCRKTEYGTYKVRFYDETDQVRDRTFKSHTEAKAFMRAVKLREDLDYWYPSLQPQESRPKLGTFGELAANWLEHAEKVRQISESCLINYRGHLRLHILPVLADRLLKDLNINDIEDVAKELATKKPRSRSYLAVRKNRMEDDDFYEDDEFLSVVYRRDILIVACMITKHGFERGMLPANPFREFKLPDPAEQPFDYWSLAEEDKFLDWLENGGPYLKYTTVPHSKGKKKFYKPMKLRKADELYDIVLFALRSGLRKGEIGALTARDVMLDKGFIMVRRAFSMKENTMKNTTKGKTYRRIELNADMRNILERRISRAKNERALLFNIKMNSIKFFSRTCRLSGVKEIHFHSLRHTCLTNLANGYGLDAPLPLPQVQRVAGHREISTTMRYVHAEGVENTTSRQWSREDRKARAQLPSKEAEGAIRDRSPDDPAGLGMTVELRPEGQGMAVERSPESQGATEEVQKKAFGGLRLVSNRA